MDPKSRCLSPCQLLWAVEGRAVTWSPWDHWEVHPSHTQIPLSPETAAEGSAVSSVGDDPAHDWLFLGAALVSDVAATVRLGKSCGNLTVG